MNLNALQSDKLRAGFCEVLMSSALLEDCSDDVVLKMADELMDKVREV